MNRKIPALAAVAVATTLTLTACTSDEPDEPISPAEETTAPAEETTAPAEETTAPEETDTGDATELTADPATGPTLEGDGYSFTAPEGWEDVTSQAGQEGIVMAMESGSTTGLPSVNVLASPAGLLTPEVIETAGLEELKTLGEDAAVTDRVIVAGSVSPHLTATVSQSGTEYAIDQYYASSADQTYIITFSYAPDTSDEDRKSIAESVLVTFQLD